ncbi:PspC domain-containing protein [Agromyces salentinus]|uniref:Phage shock protein PspC N-terminal domain-containing protein n=1 Tax=Agromyces salentinus TaxID=269421 RepID=A0ABN2MHD5_9MICO|nr:PspC domain-containing protein [Agromyces salentinus]
METNQTDPTTDPAPEDVQGDSAPAGPPADGSVGSAPSSGAPGASTHAPGTGTGRGGTADSATGTDTGADTGEGFYAWLRRLGLPRRAGWLGGVCAGIGARLGIDPIIVRGIVVVVAVLGAPFVLLYAIAWLLLPDADGEIHLERLTRGIVDPAVVGIAVMGVLGFIPFVQGGWLGWQWWGDDWPYIADPLFGFDLMVPLRIIWTLLLVGGIVALVIWLARRASQNPPAGGGGARTASAADATRSGSASAPAGATGSSPDADAAGGPLVNDTAATTAAAGAAGATEPPVPAMGADADAIAEWREQHEAWRVAHGEWKAGQDEAMRAAKAQAAAENRAKAQALAAEADAARATRRAARPRASAAYVFTLLGLGLVAGAIAALWALGDADVADFAVPVALAAATLVLALGMVVAALRRRRSGALAFFTLVSTLALLVGLGGASFGQQGRLIGPSTSIELTRSLEYVQPLGDAYVTAYATGSSRTPTVQLNQGFGDTWITVLPGSRLLLDASEADRIDIVVFGEDGSTTTPQLDGLDLDELLIGGPEGVSAPRSGEHVDAEFTITQRTGTVYVQIQE